MSDTVTRAQSLKHSCEEDIASAVFLTCDGFGRWGRSWEPEQLDRHETSMPDSRRTNLGILWGFDLGGFLLVGGRTTLGKGKSPMFSTRDASLCGFLP